MPTLKDYAIHAFYKGSDYFKETVVGVGDIYYRTDAGVENTAWVVNLLLEQEDGHPCTSGIGFYSRCHLRPPQNKKVPHPPRKRSPFCNSSL